MYELDFVFSYHTIFFGYHTEAVPKHSNAIISFKI